LEAFFNKKQMNSALVSPFDDYNQILEKNPPDILHVFGAPNEYEARNRYHGAESDILHNLENANNISDTTIILPEQVQNAAPEESIQQILNMGANIQTPDRELYTTSDDWKSARDIASPGDTINGHTSDYHGIKTHLTGWTTLELSEDYKINTFGFPTDRNRRRNILKHNTFAQTGDTIRQIYNMSRKNKNY